MKLNLQFEGRKDPFEGDRTLRLNGLPVGARITDARVRVTPNQCIEKITFNNGTGTWGATKEPASPTHWVAADLHARRMVSRVTAVANSSDLDVTLQADIGGVWVKVAKDGTIGAPDDNELTIPLSMTSSTVDIPPLLVQRLKLTREPAPS